jgi:HSP20 family protein
MTNIPQVAPTTKSAVRDVRRYTPFASLQQEIDRVFDSFSGWRGFDAFRPSMEVAETDASIEISTELPGIDEKDVEISVANDVLTIRGEKHAEREESEKQYHVVERSYGAFERSLTLPPGTNPEAIKASMNKGVLKITLPKPAVADSQKVKINAE